MKLLPLTIVAAFVAGSSGSLVWAQGIEQYFIGANAEQRCRGDLRQYAGTGVDPGKPRWVKACVAAASNYEACLRRGSGGNDRMIACYGALKVELRLIPAQ